MSEKGKAATEELAELVLDHTEQNLPFARIGLALISLVMFIGGIYLIVANSGTQNEKEVAFGLTVLVMSLFPAHGAYQAHRSLVRLKERGKD